jgi:hypothetical protein
VVGVAINKPRASDPDIGVLAFGCHKGQSLFHTRSGYEVRTSGSNRLRLSPHPDGSSRDGPGAVRGSGSLC